MHCRQNSPENEPTSAMLRLESKPDAIEGTAESLPLMTSTGSLLGGKSSNEESQVADMAQPLPRIVSVLSQTQIKV